MDKQIETVEKTSFEDFLNSYGYLLYTSVGFSMLPFLKQKRDIIEIKKPETLQCKKYDVVLYKRANRYILHRILKVLPDGYIIAGDNNTFIETDIKDENILGVMTKVIKKGKVITPDNLWYKLYVHLWCDLYPLRFCILRMTKFICRCLCYLKRKVLGFGKNKAT